MTRLSLSFPQKVYKALQFCEEQGREDLLSWEKNGTAFKVNDRKTFERILLPKYFNTKKYNTFTRTLYAHGFTCIRTGRQPGIYSHPNFKRSDPNASSLMRKVCRKKNTNVTAPASDSSIETRKCSNSSTENSSCYSDSSSEASSNRTLFKLRSKTLNVLQKCHFPPLLDESLFEGDNDTAFTFGRSYHTIASQDANHQVTSLKIQPLEIPSSGSDLVEVFDVGTRPYSNRTSQTFGSDFHRTTSGSNTALFGSWGWEPMNIASNESSPGEASSKNVAPSQVFMRSSQQQVNQTSLIQSRDVFGAIALQSSHEQDVQIVVAL